MATKNEKHSVIYWDGGIEVGQWRRTFVTHPSVKEALESVGEIERAGRVAYAPKTASLDVVGVPDTPPSLDSFRRVGFIT